MLINNIPRIKMAGINIGSGKYSSLLRILGFMTAIVRAHADIPLSCPSKIFCSGELLKTVQLAEIYPDSKTFVDMRLVETPNTTLAAFDHLMTSTNNNPSRADIESFVTDYFIEGDELEVWSPPDHNMSPAFLDNIKDENFKGFASSLLGIWPTLGRKAIKDVEENPDKYSFVYLPNGFIIPGGRFKEIYYWDTYWIVKGLLISEMKDTVRGILENFLHLVKLFGHIPNGSRVYYAERSQPPLLAKMIEEYIDYTNDLPWLRNNIHTLEKELEFWYNQRSITVERGSTKHELLQYRAESLGPRPESFREDFIAGEEFPDNDKQRFYTDIKSAAESGWDFSSRWFFNGNGISDNLNDIQTTSVVPVDLNAIYANACKILGNLYSKIGDRRNSKKWLQLSAQFTKAIQEVLWDQEDGVWYDYDLKNNASRKLFYPSNVFPLWLKSFPSGYTASYYGNRVLNYLEKSGALDFVGGIPTSLAATNQQWDLPNAWAPLQAAVIFGLYESGNVDAMDKAIELAQKWVRANYIGFKKSSDMYEKYDANVLGQYGGGGEYVVQAGFGWTNGFAIQCLDKFGKFITASDT